MDVDLSKWHSMLLSMSTPALTPPPPPPSFHRLHNYDDNDGHGYDCGHVSGHDDYSLCAAKGQQDRATENSFIFDRKNERTNERTRR